MDTDLIADADRLHRWCQQAHGPLAVDTESDHFHAYQPRVCLIQLATAESTALVDPLALQPGDLQPLFELFEDDDVPKILHAGRNDINEMDRDFGVGIESMFDTRTAARFLGYRRNSLDWLLEELLAVEPGPKKSRYNWAKRPIDDKALRYAIGDVHHLIRLRDRFLDELDAQGWIQPFRQRCQYVARSVEFQSKSFDDDGWRELRGTKNLDGPARCAAQTLYRWRHQLCTKLNRSPVTIFPNRALVKLARSRPDSAQTLQDLSGIPTPLVEDHGAELLEILDQARHANTPPAKPARPPRDNTGRPSPQQRARYNALRKWRNSIADELDIPGEFIATNAVITEIAADPPADLQQLSQFDAILPWHIDMLGEEMLATLNNASR